MKIKPLLLKVNFGEDVAEHDNELAHYFVETSTFVDVINDRTDLILGEKGSGKTALLRYLAEPEAPIVNLLDTDLLRAFNVEGDVIFREISNRERLTEAALRVTWMTYIVALLGNHLLHAYKSDIDTRDLRKRFRNAGLLAESNEPSSAWKMVSQLLGRLELEGEVSFDAYKIPVKPKGRFRWNRRVSDNKFVNLDELLRIEMEMLELLERKVWLLFDRIDEAFPTDRKLEQRALRSLLRTIIDLGSHGGRLRIKCALRSDVFHHITEKKGFVNATHLRRRKIEWDRDGLIDLVARRVAADSELARQLSIDTAELNTFTGRLAICERVLPRSVGGQPLFDWLEKRTTDARKKPNPRNVVTLLGLARTRQLVAYDRDDPDYEVDESLISESVMQDAAAELSEQRLEDTVLAEFSRLRPAVEAMRDGPSRIAREDLARAMDLEATHDMKALVEDLVYCGVVSIDGDVLSVPILYRPALKSRMGRIGRKKISQIEQRVLEGRVRALLPDLQNGATDVVTVDDLDRVQCTHIAQYVRNNYPILTAQEQKGVGPYSLMYVELKLKHPNRDEVRRPNLPNDDFVSVEYVREAIGGLVKEVAEGKSLVISEDFNEQLLRVIPRFVPAASSRIGIVARLESEDDNGSAALMLAKDIPGENIDEQDEHLMMYAEHADTLREYVGHIANIVAQTGRYATLRPHGTAAISIIVAVLRARSDVTYRMKDASGGTAISLTVVMQS